MTSDAGDIIRDRDTNQAVALKEGAITDADDTIRNGDFGQAFRAIEGIIPNTDDPLTFDSRRNGYRARCIFLSHLDMVTALSFTSYFKLGSTGISSFAGSRRDDLAVRNC